MIGHAKFVKVTLAILCAATSLASASTKERVPIKAADIATALASAGVRVTADQIEQLSTVPAAKAGPALKLVNLAPLDGDLVKARLRCESSRICLPFYVLVHWQNSTPPNGSTASEHQAEATVLRSVKKSEAMVHSGRNATMILDGNEFRITLPVICLQSGGRGQRVRVMSTDRKRTFVAQVTGEGVVRAGSGK